jgi:hypothetical protein
MKRHWRHLALRWLWRRQLSRPGNQPLVLAAAANLTFGSVEKASWRSRFISRSSQKIGQQWMHSTALRSLRAERTMDPRAFAHYHPNYYGAFVLDPDGHNIEAVCHAPA